MNTSRNAALSFGPFVLHPGGKILLLEGKPVQLGSRAFEVLVVLAEQAGAVVSHADLVHRVWPHSVVEENSLRVHISALRRALGETPERRYIVNVPGRGYSLVAEVERIAVEPRKAQVSWAALDAPVGLPARLTRVIGREAVTAELGGQLAVHRMVTIVGPGGQGKTTVALAVAERERGGYRDGVRFVDLAVLTDARQVPYAVASALGVSLALDDPLGGLCARLSDARLLLVLDNCEHVLDAAALLVERVLAAAPGVHLLLTSREALYADGEWVHRLPALATPESGALDSPAQALKYAAVQLFVERAESSADYFSLSEENMETVAHLCRQLDGIPLAIELAAARVDSLGVDGLAARIDDLFGLLTRGRRNALPRHGTLEALFDWSYALLSDNEKLVLARLSVFRSAFSLEAAARVCASGMLAPSDVDDAVMGLAVKSLIAVETGDKQRNYRLLHTTRRYAAHRLAEGGGANQVFLAHAQHMKQVFTQANSDLERMAPHLWVRVYGATPPDLWAALDWCFGEDGDLVLGLDLTVTAWFSTLELGMLNEYRGRVKTALARLTEHGREHPELLPQLERLELRLLSAMSLLAGQSEQGLYEYGAVRDRLLPLMQRLGGTCGDVEAIHSMCIGAFGHGDYFWVRMLAMRISEVACAPGPDPAGLKPVYSLLSTRWTALTAHYLGEHGRARTLAAVVADSPVEQRHVSLLGQVPRRVSMRILLARIDWLEGRADRALALANEAVELSADEHPFALCQALALALIPIALWRGDLNLAWREAERLHEFASRHVLEYWVSWGRAYLRVLELQAGPQEASVSPEWQLTGNILTLDMMATLDNLMLSPSALTRIDQNAVGWNAPEALRRRANRMLASEPGAGESMLQRGLALARCQGALGWELRCTISLVQHWAACGRQGDGYQMLASIYAQFEEGSDTHDLRVARALLARLAGYVRPAPTP